MLGIMGYELEPFYRVPTLYNFLKFPSKIPQIRKIRGKCGEEGMWKMRQMGKKWGECQCGKGVTQFMGENIEAC